MQKESWDSLYRKTKFYERQKEKKRKQYLEKYGEDVLSRGYRKRLLESSIFKKTKQIAIMLDLEGTSEKINEDTAKIFIKQIEFMRNKFQADQATISLSTSYRDSSKMQNILNVLEHHITDKIKFGLNFYYGGIYDFYDKKEELQEPGFNLNKVSTFECFYLQDFEIENLWFAIIDDNLPNDIYKNYQELHPMLQILPSKRGGNFNSNFMCYETATKDFDGVIEGLNVYIETIKNLSPEQILEKQKNMMVHLSSWELTNKIRNKEYLFLERYFREGYADKDDYADTLTWLGFIKKEECSKEELLQIKNVLGLIGNKFEKEENELALKN